MSNPNAERDERVRQIRERLASDKSAQPTRDEADYLLSLAGDAQVNKENSPVRHRAFLGDLREVEALEAEIESRKIRLLHHCGWAHSSAYADCYWRWSKTIRGKLITTADVNEALRLEERISPCDEKCNHD